MAGHHICCCSKCESTCPHSKPSFFLILADIPEWALSHISCCPGSKQSITDQMRDSREKARSALAKTKDDMKQYYNQCWAPAPVFTSGDKAYFNSTDIQITQPLKKLSHHQLGPYLVKRCIGKYAYHLILLSSMRHLHPVFNVVKLTPALEDLISERHQNPPPSPELLDSKEEYVVEKILNSRMF